MGSQARLLGTYKKGIRGAGGAGKLCGPEGTVLATDTRGHNMYVCEPVILQGIFWSICPALIHALNGRWIVDINVQLKRSLCSGWYTREIKSQP